MNLPDPNSHLPGVGAAHLLSAPKANLLRSKYTPKLRLTSARGSWWQCRHGRVISASDPYPIVEVPDTLAPRGIRVDPQPPTTERHSVQAVLPAKQNANFRRGACPYASCAARFYSYKGSVSLLPPTRPLLFAVSRVVPA